MEGFWIFATAVFLVLAFFLYRHPKRTLIGLGGLVALALAIALVVIVYQKITDLNSMVEVAVRYDTTVCDGGYPLRVDIANRADKALENTVWYVSAYVPGRSTDVVEYGGRYESDHIIEPNAKITLCYKTPELEGDYKPSALQWRVDSHTTDFR